MFFRRQSGTACGRYEARLEDYLGSHLPPELAAEVESHLAQCDACRQAAEAARGVTHLFGLAHEPAPEPSSDFAGRVMARIRRAQDSSAGDRRFWRPLEIVAWRLSWSTLVALAVLAAFLFGLQYSKGPQPPIAQGPEVRDLVPEPAPNPASQDDVLLTVAVNASGSQHER